MKTGRKSYTAIGKDVLVQSLAGPAAGLIKSSIRKRKVGLSREPARIEFVNPQRWATSLGTGHSSSRQQSKF